MSDESGSVDAQPDRLKHAALRWTGSQLQPHPAGLRLDPLSFCTMPENEAATPGPSAALLEIEEVDGSLSLIWDDLLLSGNVPDTKYPAPIKSCFSLSMVPS